MAKVKADDLSWTWSMIESAPSKPAVTVAVSTGGSAAGAAALYRIASGEMLGVDQPVTINVLGADAATIKDVEAIGFPLLKGISSSASESAVMSGAAYAIALGGDMAALGKAASKGCLVGAAGCANAAKAAKGSSAVVTAITSAPALAASVELATAAGVSPSAVEHVRCAPPTTHRPPCTALFGGGAALAAVASMPRASALCAAIEPLPSAVPPNSQPRPPKPLPEPLPSAWPFAPQVISWADGTVDISHATVAGKWALKDGAAPMPAVGDISEGIEADAAVSHMKNLALGSEGAWVSMGVPAVGDYGMGSGFYYSVPVVCTPGAYKRVGGVTLTTDVAAALESGRVALTSSAAA